ncbi:hypothetical protein [Ralstonia solanacearum]|uniref:hypothetical protein n=1 Tax=Ralstonia solanacearum TaxID=305 RepID=UPI000698D9CB|nr:hypothetical protein [Ralstonia solanacearum]AMP72802.1 hypothetical protein RALBFv3_00880 [Ralstonia solanacearum]MCL9827513.1 hypothetical protein [Ralstonia solanacearum]MCL9833036.1 hypothetical protein [Ralstonia solanacearum]MCL9837817.1 hypothetical protein [Ralstonia solanacearum]
MPVTTKRFAFGARAERFRLVLLALAVFLCGWSLVGEAANVPVRSGSAGLTTWSVETLTLESVVAATEAGVQVGRDIVSRVGYAGKQIGTVAAVEVSAIGVADIAAVVARASTPVMLAMLAGDLALRGLQQCAGGGTGWCKRAPVNPSEGDTGFNGFGWSYGYNTVSTGGGIGTGIAASPGAACSAIAASDAYLAGQNARLSSMRPTGNGTSYECHFTNDGGSNFYAGTSQAGSCVSGYPSMYEALKPVLADLHAQFGIHDLVAHVSARDGSFWLATGPRPGHFYGPPSPFDTEYDRWVADRA